MVAAAHSVLCRYQACFVIYAVRTDGVAAFILLTGGQQNCIVTAHAIASLS